MIAICGIIFGGIMGIAVMFFEHHRKKLAHDIARLALENAPSEPKVDQTTLLRIILPLKQPKKAAGVAAR